MTMRLPPLTAGYGSGPALGTYTATGHPGHGQATAPAGHALRQMAGPLHTAPALELDQYGRPASGTLQQQGWFYILQLQKAFRQNPCEMTPQPDGTPAELGEACWGREGTSADLDYRCYDRTVELCSQQLGSGQPECVPALGLGNHVTG